MNWQRDISIEERNGARVVVKRNKPTKEFHELIIIYTYSLISILLGHPSAPASPQLLAANEGQKMRTELARLGVPTPKLISISDEYLIEEFIEGGDLYRAFSSQAQPVLASLAGTLTGKLHRADLAFIDNKAQNYLVKDSVVIRTDLGFTKTGCNEFARSMDIGSFLASTMDLSHYADIERAFFEGYASETGRKFSYLSILVRNLLSMGFSSNSRITFRNMSLDSRPFLES